MAQPVLLAVDNEPDTLAAMKRDLSRRFAADYRIVTAETPEAALAQLEVDDQVAVAMAGQWLTDTTGVDFLNTCHQLHPAAKRLLLITYGDMAAGRAALRAMALGQLDHYLNKPLRDPELELYRTVTELLSQRSRAAVAAGSEPEIVRIVGPKWSARSHQLRDLLTRNSIPHGFYDVAKPEGHQLLQQAGVTSADYPIIVLFDGRVLIDPPNERIAEVLGVQTRPTSSLYDLAVVGGGPAGLTAAMYAASEGLVTLLLEREAIGGQAGTTSLIRNYLGFPHGISGRELAARAMEQAMIMGAEMVFIRSAVGLESRGEDRVLTLIDGSQACSRTVVIATGVTYRQLNVPGTDTMLGAGVFYGAAVTEAAALEGQPAFVVGGANAAGQAAVHLARFASHVTLLVRGPSLSVRMSTYLINELERASNISVWLNTTVSGVRGQGRLEAITVRDSTTGQERTAAAAALFVLIGADPHSEWLADAVERDARGFLLTGSDLGRWPLDRPPLLQETSTPGVFAAGDVRCGSVKRVASAVGEGASAIQQVHHYLATS
ncbi:MAG TPA: FAD-dependent oxidoreductase [Propionibacteriaceae bacterium]|jgi:thioredoxin reductase (NADPH)|nr:FAD-dependent oxidoreductase [Propionibacteriaceae bacterium]